MTKRTARCAEQLVRSATARLQGLLLLSTGHYRHGMRVGLHAKIVSFSRLT